MRSLSLTLAFAAMLVGCQQRAKTNATLIPKAVTPISVDCRRVCWRTFGECSREVLITTARVTEQLLEQYEQSGLLQAFQLAGFQRCVRLCGRAQLTGKSPAVINRCLALKSCVDYANCLSPKHAIKNPSPNLGRVPDHTHSF